MHAIEAKKVTRSVRIEVVTSLAYQLYSCTTYPSSEDYSNVCHQLVTKYPVLKDTIGNGIVSVIKSVNVGSLLHT